MKRQGPEPFQDPERGSEAANSIDEKSKPVAEHPKPSETVPPSENSDSEDSKASEPNAASDKKDTGASEKKDAWYQKLNLRGYSQIRYSYPIHLEPGSAAPQLAGDSSVGSTGEFSIRRARLILFGDVGDHVFIYVQPDFANSPSSDSDSIFFGQLRDCYADLYLDSDKVHRFRVGQSKVPYGWENLQSSQNRIFLDRNDAFNSATKNERDLGAFYYWTPQAAQDIFDFISDEGLKGSGNYGVFGLGVCNGQGGSLHEQNGELHWMSRLAIPWFDSCGQLHEFGIQAYTGRYVVSGAEISPLGINPALQPLGTLGTPAGGEGMLDQRLGWTYVRYPQPFGFQAEYTIGRGPELNATQTELERGSLHGGYVMANYRLMTPSGGEVWPFVRYQYYRGGYKTAANAPSAKVNEWNVGVEWQISKNAELVTEYLITDRTNLSAQSSGRSYDQFDGHLLRFQLQFNY